MTAQVGLRTSNHGRLTEIAVHGDDRGTMWATCPECPGWSAAADDWNALCYLIGEWHAADAPHRDWIAVDQPRHTMTWAAA